MLKRNNNNDDDDDDLHVEGDEQVEDSCSSAADPSPGSRRESWGNNYLINKLITNRHDGERFVLVMKIMKDLRLLGSQ